MYQLSLRCQSLSSKCSDDWSDQSVKSMSHMFSFLCSQYRQLEERRQIEQIKADWRTRQLSVDSDSLHLLDHSSQFCGFTIQRGGSDRIVTFSQGTHGELCLVLITVRVLAPLILVVFISILPTILLAFLKFEGLIEVETMQHPSLFSKLATFTILQTFFIVSSHDITLSICCRLNVLHCQQLNCSRQ